MRLSIRNLQVSHAAGRLVIMETKASAIFRVAVMMIVGCIVVVWFRAWGGNVWLTDPVFLVPLVCFLAIISAAIKYFLKPFDRTPMLVFDRDTNSVQRYGRPLCSLSDMVSVTITYHPSGGGGKSPPGYSLDLVLKNGKRVRVDAAGDDGEISRVAQTISDYARLGNPTRETPQVYTEFHFPWSKR